MALSKEDREEMIEMMSEATAKGLAIFNSAIEEREEKRKAESGEGETGGNSDSGSGGLGFSLPGFLLGDIGRR